MSHIYVLLFLYMLLTLLYGLQKYLADILSVLALTMSAEGERVCKNLSFELLCFY